MSQESYIGEDKTNVGKNRIDKQQRQNRKHSPYSCRGQTHLLSRKGENHFPERQSDSNEFCGMLKQSQCIQTKELAALIREFYSNLSIHVYDSNTSVKSWIRGVEFTITPSVVADSLGVPVV